MSLALKTLRRLVLSGKGESHQFGEDSHMHVTHVTVVTCCFCLERVPHQGLVASPVSGTSHARGDLSALQENPCGMLQADP